MKSTNNQKEKQNTTSGNTKKRSVPAIALKASNEEGGYFSCHYTQENGSTAIFGKRYQYIKTQLTELINQQENKNNQS